MIFGEVFKRIPATVGSRSFSRDYCCLWNISYQARQGSMLLDYLSIEQFYHSGKNAI